MRVQIILILIGVVVISLTAGCVQQPAPTTPTPTATTVPPTTVPSTTVPQADTIKLGSTSLGLVLTDAKGMTLYYFAKDIPSAGTSACSGGCSAVWPTFSVNTVSVSAPLDSSDFSMFTRADNTTQVAYKGYPLYYYGNDTKPGDTNGEGILGLWAVMKQDYAIMVEQQSSVGIFLADEYGRSLYVLTKDSTGTSTCNGSCATTWPPFGADALSAPSLVKNSDFNYITRTDGMNQTAYKGRPLYFYSGDQKPGNINGNGVAGVWFVANVTGAVPASPTPTPTQTTRPPTTSPGGGGGYGY